MAWPYLKLGFTPTAVSLFGVVLATLAALAFRLGFMSLAFCLALVAVLTDLADGEVARATGSASPAGNYIDAMGDRLREGFLLVGLLPLAPNLVVLALLGTFLTSFAKARCGLVLISDNRDWPGFGDHPDRAVLILCAYALGAQNLWPLQVLVAATWSCFLIRTRYALSSIRQARDEELLPYLRIVAAVPAIEVDDKSREHKDGAG